MELLGHELRAPVSALQNSAELLVDYLDGDLSSAEAQAEVRRIHRLSLRLGMMIQDLYEMARISSGAWEIALAEIDPLEVVTSAIDIARALPGMPAISTDAVAERLTVPGDARRLSGVVLSLLTNAAKHAPQTERIDVRIRSNDQNLMIDVEDYGPGIPPEDLPRIFNRYFQSCQHRRNGSRSSARHSDGLGLGLFIAQQIVQAHHGQIAVTSEVGTGTRFTIQLPRY